MKNKPLIKLFIFFVSLIIILGFVIFMAHPCPTQYILTIYPDSHQRPFHEKVINWYVKKFCPKSIPVTRTPDNIAFAAGFATDLENFASTNANLVWSYIKVGLFDAWNELNNGSFAEIKIGIIDTGIDASDGRHPEFMDVNLGDTQAFSLKDRAAEFGAPTGHGTPVAGIIGANNKSSVASLPSDSPQINGVLSGVHGLDYSLNIKNLRFITMIDFSRLLNDFPQDSLINLSIQQTDCSLLLIFCIKGADFNAATQYYREGFIKNPDKLFIVAAGNNSLNVNDVVPSNLNLNNTFIVGATDQNDFRPTFSNFGAGIDLSAPGTEIYAPAIRGQGNYPAQGADAFNYSTQFRGTSFAAPFVTGVAGLIKSIKPELTPAQIKQILIESADPIATGEPGKLLGTGCYDPNNNPNNYTGCRLNAHSAVCFVSLGGSGFGEIFVHDLTTGAEQNLTASPSFENTLDWSPEFSPNGSQIAFMSTGNHPGNFEIYVMNTDGQQKQRLTFDAAEDIYPAWSPDGSEIAFRRTLGGNSEIFILTLATLATRNLTNNPAQDDVPDW